MMNFANTKQRYNDEVAEAIKEIAKKYNYETMIENYNVVVSSGAKIHQTEGDSGVVPPKATIDDVFADGSQYWEPVAQLATEFVWANTTPTANAVVVGGITVHPQMVVGFPKWVQDNFAYMDAFLSGFEPADRAEFGRIIRQFL